MTKSIPIGDRCVWCGEDTSAGSGKFVNRLGVGTTGDTVAWLPAVMRQHHIYVDGWSCADCAGYECDACGKQIYLDDDVHDGEGYHYHPECLPVEEHAGFAEDEPCGCHLCEAQANG